MAVVVGHNTEVMRQWSGNIINSAKEYDDLINSLYNLVDSLVGSEFTGGLSTDFEESVLRQKDNFRRLSETLQECADLISNTSNKIDDDEAYLRSQIQNNSVF